jgi:hypothetical protein
MGFKLTECMRGFLLDPVPGIMMKELCTVTEG